MLKIGIPFFNVRHRGFPAVAMIVCGLGQVCVGNVTAEASIAQSAKEGKPVLKVKWMPACLEKSTEPFFKVDIYKDGSIRYVGGAQAKEQGEQRGQIAESDLKRLLTTARRFVNGWSGPLKNQITNGDPDSSYCLHVVVGSKTNRGRSDVKQTQALIQALDEIVNEKQWICPARWNNGPSENRLRSALYCKHEWVIEALFADERTCHSYHFFDIYEDGTIYYQADHRILTGEGPATQELAAIHYYKMTPTDFTRIIDLISTFRFLTITGVPDHAGDGPLSILSMNDPTSMKAFREVLEDVADIRWFQFPPDAMPCKFDRYRPRTAMQVRTDMKALADRPLVPSK